MRWTLPIAAVALWAAVSPASASAQAPAWSFHGEIALGRQFDAVADRDAERIHLVSSRYYQIDRDGSVVVDEDEGDERQGDLHFPPAITVGPDGSAHLVTRHGGSLSDGHDIRYRKRETDGTWSTNELVGTPEARNYVVGVTATPNDRVLVMRSRLGSGIQSFIDFYDVTDGTPTSLGATPDENWLRADADYRIATADNRMFLVTGSPGPRTSADFVHLLRPLTGGDVVGALSSAHDVLDAGEVRRGIPDVATDGTGEAHVTYGARHGVYYNRWGKTGDAAFAEDVLLFDDLGGWHLCLGLSAVAASDDGSKVVAVALRTGCTPCDGTECTVCTDGDTDCQRAVGSEMVWRYSPDGGDTWSEVLSVGRDTDGGEGRLRPRVVALGDRFFLLWAVTGGSRRIHLATVDVPDDFPTPGEDAGPGGDGGVIDAGPDSDAGPSQDAGPSDDAGSGTDAGGGTDAGSGDAGAESGGDGGCGCRTAPWSRGGAPWAWLLGVVAGVLLWRRRR